MANLSDGLSQILEELQFYDQLSPKERELFENHEKMEKELEDQIKRAKSDKSFKIDMILKAMVELTEAMLKYNQLKTVNDNEEVTRLCRVRVNGINKKVVKKYFKIDAISFPGAGLFIPLEGKFFSGSYNDISASYYDTRLIMKALDKYFVPKRTQLTEMIKSTKQIEYLEVYEY